MRFLLLIALLLTSFSLAAKPATPKKSCRFGPVKIGVLDTGFGFEFKGLEAPLCKYGHKDFSSDGQSQSLPNVKVPVPVDLHGHGTNVVGLIDKYASTGSNPYCFVIIKYYSQTQTGRQNLQASIKAIQYANNLNLDVINFSGGGEEANGDEGSAVKKFLDNGGLFIAAAGNEGLLLDNFHTYYPAMYDKRITVVGNLTYLGIKQKNSNYGPRVTTWEFGTEQTAYGITMTGTSQATAIATGKRVAKLPKNCDR